MAAQPQTPPLDDVDADREVFRFRVEHLDAMPDDGNKYELIDGMLLVSPAPNRRHEYVVRELFLSLHRHLEDTDGEAFPSQINNKYANDTLLIPDITVFAPGGRDPVRDDTDRLGDLVVEVSSPSTRHRDLRMKRDVYEREGVPEYWFIDLGSDRLLVHVLTDDGYEVTVHGVNDLATSTLLPGFTTTLVALLP